MKFDGDTIFALVLLVGPAAALAYWHKVEWGAGFGPTSRLWRTSSVVAALLLASLVALTFYYGADEFRAFMLLRCRMVDVRGLGVSSAFGAVRPHLSELTKPLPLTRRVS